MITRIRVIDDRRPRTRRRNPCVGRRVLLLSCLGFLPFAFPAHGRDGLEVVKWEWTRGDGAIFGDANYKSELSHPRGIVSLPELAREAVEAFSISGRQSIIRVKETGECVTVFHYATRGEDDAYGVYAIDFGRGGERLLFKQGERLNAPRGITHLSRFPTLTELTLPDADVSTDELQSIASCGRLRMLMLGTPHVNDAVATSLSRTESLQALRIASARLSVEGIRALASMPRLEALSLRDQDVPPGSFAILRSAPRLRFLDLDQSRFDPSELSAFVESATLDFLALNDTSVADRHVDLLARLMVTKLSLARTKISASGLTRLLREKPAFMQVGAYRPDSWHGWQSPSLHETGHPTLLLEPAVMPPRYEPIDSLVRAERADRRAELVEFLRNRLWEGTYRRGRTPEAMRPGAAIPQDAIVCEIHLKKGAITTDRELATLGGLRPQNLSMTWHVDLSDSQVTGRGFRGWRHGRVESLDLSGSKVDDDGMRYMGRAASGTRLRLSRTRITGNGLRWLPPEARLRELALNDTTIDDAAVQQLIDSGRLANELELELDGTRVTDVSLAALARLNRLQRLSIRRTQTTPEGIQNLRRTNPACEITADLSSHSP